MCGGVAGFSSRWGGERRTAARVTAGAGTLAPLPPKPSMCFGKDGESVVAVEENEVASDAGSEHYCDAGRDKNPRSHKLRIEPEDADKSDRQNCVENDARNGARTNAEDEQANVDKDSD